MELDKLTLLIKNQCPVHFREICTALEVLSDELSYTKVALSNSLIKAQNRDDFSLAREILDAQERLTEYIATIAEYLKQYADEKSDEDSPVDSKNYKENSQQSNSDNKHFFIKRKGMRLGRDIDATCVIQNNQFVVLKGSLVATVPRNVNEGKDCFHKKYGVFIDNNGRLTQDIVFDSVSGSSSFVLYGASNGNVDW